jgi:hypothetical protein
MYLLIRAERGIGKLFRGFTAKPASQGLQNGDVKPLSKKEQRVNSLKANARAKMGNFESIAKIPDEVDEDSKRINFWRREEQEDVPKVSPPREERDQAGKESPESRKMRSKLTKKTLWSLEERSTNLRS